MEELPDELIWHILTFLPTRDVMRVSHAARHKVLEQLQQWARGTLGRDHELLFTVIHGDREVPIQPQYLPLVGDMMDIGVVPIETLPFDTYWPMLQCYHTLLLVHIGEVEFYVRYPNWLMAIYSWLRGLSISTRVFTLFLNHSAYAYSFETYRADVQELQRLQDLTGIASGDPRVPDHMANIYLPQNRQIIAHVLEQMNRAFGSRLTYHDATFMQFMETLFNLFACMMYMAREVIASNYINIMYKGHDPRVRKKLQQLGNGYVVHNNFLYRDDVHYGIMKLAIILGIDGSK